MMGVKASVLACVCLLVCSAPVASGVVQQRAMKPEMPLGQCAFVVEPFVKTNVLKALLGEPL